MKKTKTKADLVFLLGLILVMASLSFLVYQALSLNQKKEAAINLEKDFLEAKVTEPGDVVAESAIGVLRVDKLGLVLPIYGDVNQIALADGAGVVETTDFPTSQKNTISVLAAHRGGTNETYSFLNIHKLSPGDSFKVTTREEVLTYDVVGEEIIAPTDWSRFIREEDKAKVYLMSCHPYPQDLQRLLIKAELREAVKVQ